jgi:hypothetical protein
MYVGFPNKCPKFLFYFTLPKDSTKNSQSKDPRKSVQWEPSCSMQTRTKLYCNFAVHFLRT